MGMYMAAKNETEAGMEGHVPPYRWLQMRQAKKLPILSTIPRSGTWFLRYAISFLSHLDRGGRIDDRITREIVGCPSGAPFDFGRFRGGPLFLARNTMPYDHVFIGHTVCPGFADTAGDFAWWPKTAFHVPGYDYLHEGLNYKYTPIDLATYKYTPVPIRSLERAVSTGRSAPLALVHRNPLTQAASYFRYCVGHASATYNTLQGRPLADVPFRDYLFGSALPSYAKQFVSFQAMATRHPGLVRLVPYEDLMARPVEVLASLLNHLSGTSRNDWHNLHCAVHLARREHLKAVEAELGRSLDGTRAGSGSHMRQGGREELFDDAIREKTIGRLRSMGVDTAQIVWALSNDDNFRNGHFRQEQRAAAE